MPRVFDMEAACPAGAAIAETSQGSGCRCRVEHTSLTATNNPSSLIRYCLSRDGYKFCPTWRSEKDRIEAGRVAPLVEDSGRDD
jgi:hypothetical protein